MSQYSDAVHHAKTRATRAMLALPDSDARMEMAGAKLAEAKKEAP